jgi:hypothetical protein
MNKKERKLITELFWRLQNRKNEHHLVYMAQEVLQSIIEKDYGIARNILNIGRDNKTW